MNYYAHIDYNQRIHERKQLLKVHLNNVKEISEMEGQKFGLSYIAGLASVLHDVGKYTLEFQNYILGKSNVVRGEIDHATAGAALLERWFGTEKDTISSITREIIQNVIMSHHGGLKDVVVNDEVLPFNKRLNKTIEHLDEIEESFLEEVMTFKDIEMYFKNAKNEVGRFLLRSLNGELKHVNTPSKEWRSQRMRVYTVLLTKTIFSLLIDADRTDAGLFSEQKAYQPVSFQKKFAQYQERLEKQITYLQEKSKENFISQKNLEINRLRERMSKDCFDAATKGTGIYQLSIPTGGGKTLASLRYALQHAKLQGKEHIVYVIPYTSIIEQNAEEIKNILQAHNEILEHHSNYVDENIKGQPFFRKMQMDNWDAPIIFTTMVQYLDVFYNNKGRNIRRLHRLLNSVVIFDEVQAIPPKTLHMFNETLNFIKYGVGSTALLCTATQPALKYMQKNVVGIDGELISLTESELSVFERVCVKVEMETPWTTSVITRCIETEIKAGKSVLSIFNTKATADAAYTLLNEGDMKAHIYYLTTNMCASHRLDVINKMKKNLANGEPVVCLSTSLIEAGVNVSFHTVMRAISGLDSIMQAAGRCNRHGELEMGNFIIYNHADDCLDYSFEQKSAQMEAMRICYLLKNKSSLLFSKQILKTYFRAYYQRLTDNFLNYPCNTNQTLYQLLYSSNQSIVSNGIHIPQTLRGSHDTVGKHFKPIDESTIAVLVPYKEGTAFIQMIEDSFDSQKELPPSFYRNVQRYTVSIFENQFKNLFKSGEIKGIEIDGAIFYVASLNIYDDLKGIKHAKK